MQIPVDLHIRQSLIVARLILALMKAVHRDHRPNGKKIDAAFPEVLVGSAVFVLGWRRRKPISASEIERETGIPRSNVRRHANAMVSHGILIRDGTGYLINRAYFTDRQDRRARENAVKIIILAANEMLKIVADLDKTPACWPFWPSIAMWPLWPAIMAALNGEIPC